jgi:hypothetical protein
MSLNHSIPRYLTFSDIIDRYGSWSGILDPESLKLLTPKQALCIGVLPEQYALRSRNGNEVIVQLPGGCKVKRGFSVDTVDSVSVADIHKILTFTTDKGQNYIAVRDLVDNDDLLDPNA